MGDKHSQEVPVRCCYNVVMVVVVDKKMIGDTKRWQEDVRGREEKKKGWTRTRSRDEERKHE